MASQSSTESFEYDAFISYRTTDQKAAMEIVAELERSGVKCWIAPRNIRPGREYGDEIIAGIKNSKTLIVIISSQSIHSRHVRAEVERAISLGHKVFPVRIENVDIGQSLEFFLSSVQWTDVFDDLGGVEIEKLISTILTSDLPRNSSISSKFSLPRWTKWILPSFMAGMSVFLLSFLFSYVYQHLIKNDYDKTLKKAEAVTQKIIEDKEKEYIPDLGKIQVEAKFYRSHITVSIIRESLGDKAVIFNPYFIVNGSRTSTKGSLFFKVEGHVEDVVFGIESQKNEPIEEIDITNLVNNAIDAAINYSIKKASSNIECNIGGCTFGNELKELVCGNQSANVSVRQSGQSDWVDLPDVCGHYSSVRTMCYSYSDFKFSLDPSKTIDFRFQLGNQEPIYTTKHLDENSLRYRIRNQEPSFDNWLVLEPIKEKSPGGAIPLALLAYQPAHVVVGGFKLISGIEGCAYRQKGRGRIALNGWLVDLDGMGLLRIGSDLGLTGKHNRLKIDEALRLSKKSQLIAIAADLEDGSREGPYWYRLDLLKAIDLAASQITPKVECKASSSHRDKGKFLCKPEDPVGWINVRSVEFGQLPDQLEKRFDINFTATEYIKSSCEYNSNLDCDPFTFEVPNDWKNVFYRINTKKNGSQRIERVVVHH